MRTRTACLLAVLTLIGVFAQAPVVAGSEPRARRSVAGVWFSFPDRDVHITRAEMRRAVPARFTPDAGSLRRLASEDDEGAPGEPLAVPATRPSPGSPVESINESLVAPGHEFQTHISYTRSEITDPAASPFVTHVKIISELGQGLISSCSGTIVTSANESLVSTAAHCILNPDTGTLPVSISVAPGYRLGNAPFDFLQATHAVVTPQWAQSVAQGNADPRYDIGFLLIPPAGDGTTLTDNFGSRGIMFNQSNAQLFDAFGYPGAPPFDGERLFVCDSDTSEPFIAPGSPYPLAIGCDMTGGSSGGGWIIDDQHVNSVVSFGLLDHPDVLHGPYFGTVAQALWEDASGKDPTEPVGHEVAVSLQLRKHLVAKGRMTALDGYLPCTRNAPVGVFRLTSNGVRLLRTTTTSNNGMFSVRVPDRPGRYVAFSPEGEVDEFNLCGESTSSVRRHRH